jgi:hypothetical protein
MDFSRMTQKWSSRTREQKAVRVRDNQRRHRARTKAYISDLESQLAEAIAQLDEALARNSRLAAQLGELQGRLGQESVSVSISATAAPEEHYGDQQTATDEEDTVLFAPSTFRSNTGVAVALVVPLTDRETSLSSPRGSSPCPFAASLPVDAVVAQSYGPRSKRTQLGRDKSPLSKPLEDSPSSGDKRPCAEDARSPISAARPAMPLRDNDDASVKTPANSNTDVVGVVDQDLDAETVPVLTMPRALCSNLPPTVPGESTIPCTAAYDIIQQQNYAGMDLEAFRGFLQPGYRRAARHGDGCRVESSRIYAVIDALSSS